MKNGEKRQGHDIMLFDSFSENAKDRKKVEREIEKLIEKAKKSAKKDDDYGAAYAYQVAARLAHSIADRRAVDLSIEAAKHNKRIGRNFNVGWSYRSAALYSMQFKDYSNAVNFGLKAVEYFSKTNSMYAIQWCYKLMGEASEKMNDLDLAIKSYRKANSIEHEEEIDKRIKELMRTVPHPTVRQTCKEKAASDGEQIDVELDVKNETKNPIKNIMITDGKGNEMERIPILKPGDSKTFKYKIVVGDAKIESPFKKITWIDDDGEKRERNIRPINVLNKPNIEITPYIDKNPQVGKQSHLVINVLNLSREPIKDIRLSLVFPLEIKVKPVTGYFINRINPREEEGFVFEIIPTATGKTLLRPSIEYRNEEDEIYTEAARPFVLEKALQAPPTTSPCKEETMEIPPENVENLKRIEKTKKFINSIILPKKIGELEYIELEKKLAHSSTGFTLKDVDVESVSRHIFEECKGMSLSGCHVLDNETLYLFSGQSEDGKETYLLTVAVKGEKNFVHIAFKMYSTKEENLQELLGKIANMIKHTIVAMSFAVEIQKIQMKEVINIIDSVVQRSSIGSAKPDKKITLKDSATQRTDL